MKNKSLEEFYNLVNSESPTPGGGAVVSYISSLAIGLANMAIIISKKRKSFLNYAPDIQADIMNASDRLGKFGTQLLEEIQKDVDSFAAFMSASKLPKNTNEEKQIQISAVQEASNKNILLPLHVLEITLMAYKEVELISPYVVKSIISDLAIGVIYLEAGIHSCIVNLKINLPYVNDKEILLKVENIINEANKLVSNDLQFLKSSILVKLEGGN